MRCPQEVLLPNRVKCCRRLTEFAAVWVQLQIDPQLVEEAFITNAPVC
jgi:hypothetical protein